MLLEIKTNLRVYEKNGEMIIYDRRTGKVMPHDNIPEFRLDNLKRHFMKYSLRYRQNADFMIHCFPIETDLIQIEHSTSKTYKDNIVERLTDIISNMVMLRAEYSDLALSYILRDTMALRDELREMKESKNDKKGLFDKV